MDTDHQEQHRGGEILSPEIPRVNLEEEEEKNIKMEMPVLVDSGSPSDENLPYEKETPHGLGKVPYEKEALHNLRELPCENKRLIEPLTITGVSVNVDREVREDIILEDIRLNRHAYSEFEEMPMEGEQRSQGNHFEYGNLIIFKKLLKNFKRYRKKKI